MLTALALAERGRGWVEPNPLVGAVIVRNGEIVGRGWHAKFGGPHAEVMALAEAGDRAQSATLYVTLEPCNHHGKTPPCVGAIIASGIRHVVTAMLDPFPMVKGAGVKALRNASLDVEIGDGESEARRLNAPYLILVQESRPYVHLKWAMSLDGKLATRTGDSKWISGQESRQIVHELRGRMDAIIVGSGTVAADDPLLTARPAGPRVPARIVLSSNGNISQQCRLLQTAGVAPVIIATKQQRQVPGIETMALPELAGRPSIAALLEELGRRRMTNVLVEGGSRVFAAFADAGLVDEAHVFIAPKLIGGESAMSPLAGRGCDRLENASCFTRTDIRKVGDDTYIQAVVEQKTGN